MKATPQILPIVLLLIGAVVAVWRGMNKKPDASRNRSSGGGPYFTGQHKRW